MTAMNWLATQLAWEQRLVELRSEKRPVTVSALRGARDGEVDRKAA